MRTLYEAASAIEAHMLLDLLKQQGIEAHIHGEALQGAMGEVPMNGLVRLLVAEEDHPAARAVIDRWEKTEVESTARPKLASRSSGLRGLLLGLALGVGATYAVYRAPVSTDGIDHDRDGVLDEKWTYAPSGQPLKLEVDRNLDHKVDYVAHYNARGVLDSTELDDNFDGVFETRQGFRNGNLQVSETDTDGDGFLDLRSLYVHGVIDAVEYINPATGRPLRVEHFKLGVLQFADVDTDKDGGLDQRLRYSPLGEVVSREPLSK
jgi:hypothetical protein